MSSLHISILAHGKASDVFRRHIPLWKAHNSDDILVFCPEDDRIEQSISPWPVSSFGKSEHNGREQWKRLRFWLQHLSLLDFSHFLIYEYDSFCLKSAAPSPSPRGLIGNLALNLDPVRFISSRYALPPWLIDQASLRRMQEASDYWPDIFEEGEPDRYFSALADLAAVPILPHRPAGYAEGTIKPEHFPALKQAIQAGATMIHGVKHHWSLATVQALYEDGRRA